MKDLLNNFCKLFGLTLILFSLFSFVPAFPVINPSEIEVNNSEGFFFVEVTNPYDDTRSLDINFFVPTDVQINSPKEIPANTTITAKVFVRNNFSEFTKINSTLEVYLGEELERKEISVRFYPNPTTNSTNISGNFLGLDSITSFFSLLTFFSFENISLNFIAMFFLTLIIIALLIMLIVRIARRV